MLSNHEMKCDSVINTQKNYENISQRNDTV